ncbi:hypothetical protein AVEN_210939-1 [Araneus ventricosus]|uniref:Uncharacterized protein n=1 Tax=Araneus ventricosus TaxID=182803 RepID=A0A4Y2DEX2_ARAVE|nr:hypothetical protein AVEN_210939-1 [Araneus ventricosus]
MVSFSTKLYTDTAAVILQDILKCVKGYYRRNEIQNAIFKLDSKLPNPVAVDVKNACDRISGSWNSVKTSTIRNCRKKASFFERKSDEKTNVDNTEIAEGKECAVNLATAVNAYQSSSNQSFPFNAAGF